MDFNENIEDLSGRDARVRGRADTDAILGQLLSKMETLENRSVQRWGGLRFKQAQAVYAEGDEAYLDRDYNVAAGKYSEAIELVDPLLDEVEQVFTSTYADAQVALDNADSIEAVRLFELAVAISPNHAGARSGYTRAQNLETVMSLTDQGFEFENELELEAARESFCSCRWARSEMAARTHRPGASAGVDSPDGIRPTHDRGADGAVRRRLRERSSRISHGAEDHA